MKSSSLVRPSNKSSLLLLWIFGFVGFNCWFLHLSSRYDAGIGQSIVRKTEVTRVHGGVRRSDSVSSFRSGLLENDNERYMNGIKFEAPSNDFEYDDDNPQGNHAQRDENGSIPQWQDESKDYDSAEPSSFSLSDLQARKKGKVAWLMR